MKEIINALAAATKAIRALPPAPTFDPAPLRAALVASQLPEKFIENALRESEAKFIATHGDTSERIARTVLAEIAPALGGLDSLASLTRAMRAEEVAQNSVKFTRGELDDKENEKARAFVAKAAKLYKEGKQVSEIQKELNFYSYQTLYGFVKENTDLFPSRQ